MPSRLTPPDIPAILAYAKEHGDAKAAKRFKISRRTVIRYRKAHGSSPAVTEAIRKVHREWLVEAKEARSLLLELVLKKAGQSDQTLRDLVGALKIVNDGTLAYEVVNPDGGRPDPGPGVEGAGGPPARAEGAGDAPGPVH